MVIPKVLFVRIKDSRVAVSCKKVVRLVLCKCRERLGDVTQKCRNESYLSDFLFL